MSKDNFNESSWFEETDTETVSSDMKTGATLIHFSWVAGFIIPFGGLILPIILYVTHKDKEPFFSAHAKEVLNFQITSHIVCAALMIFAFLSFFLIFTSILAIFAIAVWLLLALIFSIIGAIRASETNHYRYPISIRFIS